MQPPPIAEADRTFLIAAAEAGVVETEASRLAVERGADPAVKAAAERLIAGHAALNDELGHLAALKGVTLPAAPADEEVAKLAGLRGLAGRALDRAYLDQLAARQPAAIERYERAASESADPELRAFAAKTLPLLREYQALSRRLAADRANA